MRAYSRGLLGLIGVSLVLLGSTGCNSNGKNDSAKATAEVGNTINYGSFGTTSDLDCGDGKSLNVGGSNNTLTITGTCASVNVGGADNKMTLDTVGKDISVVGFNNTVTYKNGDPKVNDLGSGNTIKKS
jgi:Protein of unknown function (DUF3060)